MVSLNEHAACPQKAVNHTRFDVCNPILKLLVGKKTTKNPVKHQVLSKQNKKKILVIRSQFFLSV